MEVPFLFAGLLAAIVACAIAAKRFALPYPIVFVLAGSALAFVPNLPRIEVDPQYIFLVVLPPLLFNGGWATDWKLFRANLRPIFLLAVGLVAVTTGAVAVAAHALGLGWAPAFVLGAIVSPPDAVAAAAIFERFSVPRRIAAIIEGEGLVNDGAALVIYRFAVAAAVTGSFSASRAGLAMVAVAAGGIVVGFGIGFAVEAVTRALDRGGLVDSLIDNLVFLLAPYAAYLSAEGLGVSGVLSTVVAGVYVSRRSSTIYQPETRLIGRSVWGLLIYLFNGFVFLLIGLQLRDIAIDPNAGQRFLGAGVVVSVLVILVRLLWTFAATYLPRVIRLRQRDAVPSWRYVTLIAWTGLRGIVSLAAALALPLRDAAGNAFPQRREIVFITFCVIVATLVFQGLSLIPLLKWLRLEDDGEDLRVREIEVRIAALRAGLNRIITLERTQRGPQEWEVIGHLKSDYEHRIEHLRSHVPGEQAESPASRFDHKLQDEALRAERDAVMRMRDDGKIPDEIFRRIEYDLDLAETRLT